MTRERQSQSNRADAPTAAATPSLRPTPDATIVVFVGGESTRFGPEHKALATLDGEPLIRRVVRTFRAVAGRPSIIAVRTTDQRERLAQTLPRDWDAWFIRNDPGLSRSLAGVTAIADAATTSRLFVAGCDIPLLEPHAVAALFGCAARSGGDRNRDHDRHVSVDGNRPNPSAIVPVSKRDHKPLRALYRRAAVRDNVSELAPDDSLGALLNRLGSIEYAGFGALPESVDRSMTNVNARTELTRVAAGDKMRR